MTLHIVVPVKDEVEHTRRIVEQCADWPTLVIDNGSGPDTVGFLATQRTAQVYRMPGAGIHEMWNAGIDWAVHRDADVLAILNNDLEFAPGAIERTYRAVVDNTELLVACPNYDGRKGSGIERTDQICAGAYDGTGGIAGFAMFVDVDLFRAGYRFPAQFKWWWGDNDIVLSVSTKTKGWCGIVVDAAVTHIDGGGKTGNWASQEMVEATCRDRALFAEKWGRR